MSVRPRFEGMTVEHGIENGEHAPLELGAAGHGQRGERGLRAAMGRRAERLHHLEQIGGVGGGLRPVAQHVVVARMLALELEAAVGDPDERVEPEQGERELAEELGQRIEPLHVRHLVHEHVAPPLLRPLVGVVGEEHDRVDDPPGDRDAEPIAAEEDERTLDAQRVGEALREGEPAAVVDACAAPREPRDDDRAGGEPQEDDGGAERPEGDEHRAERDAGAAGAGAASRRGVDGGRRRTSMPVSRSLARRLACSSPRAVAGVDVDTRPGRAGIEYSSRDWRLAVATLASGTSGRSASGTGTRQRGPHSASTRKQELHGDRAGPDRVARRGGAAVQERGEHERGEQHDRAAGGGAEEDGDDVGHGQRPSFLAASMSRDIRSSSPSLIFSPLIASSAATACSAELSKKVLSRWESAVWRAVSRRATGR